MAGPRRQSQAHSGQWERNLELVAAQQPRAMALQKVEVLGWLLQRREMVAPVALLGPPLLREAFVPEKARSSWLQEQLALVHLALESVQSVGCRWIVEQLQTYPAGVSSEVADQAVVGQAVADPAAA